MSTLASEKKTTGICKCVSGDVQGMMNCACEKESKGYLFVTVDNSLKLNKNGSMKLYVYVGDTVTLPGRPGVVLQMHSKFFPFTYSVFLHTLGLANINCLNSNSLSTSCDS